jgi:predicted Zn-dependent protease
MSKQGGDQPPEFMSTHPSHGTRIQRLKELLGCHSGYQRAHKHSKELESAR